MISNLKKLFVFPRDKKIRVIFSFFIFFSILLFLYSFTQVDLSLTLTRAAFWIPVQDAFKAIGYFHRPLSTFLYLGISLTLSALYIMLLYLASKQKITKREVFTLIFITTLILAFSYNAFSYDLFNYIFDAKIITHYQQNPYLHKAQDYPLDPMLSFMHWTHRTYPYGPGWLALTVPLSFLGMQYFLPTLLLYKLGTAFSFLGCCYLISKISGHINKKYEVFSLVFFALNPYVLIEVLISSHNDIVMMFFALLAFWLLIEKAYMKSIFFYLFSISIKFATLLFFPIFLLISYLNFKRRDVPWEKICLFFVICGVVAVIAASIRSGVFQPWYLLYALPFAALIARKSYILIPSLVISLGALLQYVPFLFLGNWNPPVRNILHQIFLASIIIGMILTFLYVAYARHKMKQGI